MILINFKIYKETFGDGAEKLAVICRKVMKDSGVKIIPVVAAFDVIRVKEIMGSEVFIQNVDTAEEGQRTGWISIPQAVAAGANGTLMNHSEHRMKPGAIKSLLPLIPKGFVSVVCIQSLGQAEGWAKNIKSDFIETIYYLKNDLYNLIRPYLLIRLNYHFH